MKVIYKLYTEMKKKKYIQKFFTITIILLLFGTSILPIVSSLSYQISFNGSLDGNTLYVGGNGPGNYTKIQDAIDNASNGDTVFVYNDSSPYSENITIDKSIQLIGEDRDSTLINGTGIIYTIDIKADDVNVQGFSIQNQLGGIRVRSNNNKIINNNISSSHRPAISVEFNFPDCRYLNNTISENIIACRNCQGIITWSNSTFITNNYIREHDSGGIAVYSDNNIISSNTVINEIDVDPMFLMGDIHVVGNNNIIQNNTLIGLPDKTAKGIFIGGSGSRNNIVSNTIENYEYYGIHIYHEANNNSISNNLLKNNNKGLRIELLCPNNKIQNNIFIDNYLGIYLYIRCNKNTFQYNNFISNNRNVYFERFCINNVWNENYWGRARVLPYPIIGRFWVFFPWINFDWHPAQEPYEIN